MKNSASDVRSETVTIDTLDNYCAGNAIAGIYLLKIDTEGYEIEVLEGARQNLGVGSIGAVFCEVGFSSKNRRNTPLHAVTENLMEQGYFFYGLYDVTHYENRAMGESFGNALFVRQA